MDILISITAKMAEYTVKPIGRQLGYLCYHDDIIRNLVQEVEILKDTRELVQHRVHEARNNAEAIKKEVEKWLQKVDDQITKSREILHVNEGQEDKKRCSSGSCLNLVQRYQLSRKAKKMAEEVIEIRKKGRFGRVSLVENLTGISDFMSFESRISTMEEIMDALIDDNVNKIGIYGIGGVGKTMMVKEILRKVKDKKLFGVVTSINVGQAPNLKGIQGELGDQLGLKFEQETEARRAIQLHKRLKMEGSILIVLDDIWTYIDLDTIGIPNDHKGCKILFTSRDKNILCGDMCTNKDIEVKVLQQEESWNLFNQMVGEINEPKKHIAIAIIKKCANLPIAITTVAKALRNKPLPIWKDALHQLRNPSVMNIRGMDDKVYASLKLTYEHLQSEEAKLVFLLCSMFPKDHHINVEDLLVYTMGMGLLEGIDTFAIGRDRIIKLVADLTSSSLLQEIEHRDGYVKMHDLVRDVAIFIASKNDRICTLSYVQGLNEWSEEKISGNYTAAYFRFGDTHNPPRKITLPKVQLLILEGSSSFDTLEFLGTIFEEMKELKVLELMAMKISLSRSPLHSYANLRSLRLIDCKLANIDVIGELRKLEILSFKGSNIIEIPTFTSQSTKLKVLDLSCCSQLKVIPPDMLLGLTKLEELYLGSFDGWERGNLKSGGKNANLYELRDSSSRSGIILYIKEEEIVALFSKDLNLNFFNIFVGRDCELLYVDSGRNMIRHMESGSALDDLPKILLKEAEKLYLEGSIGEKFLRFLHFELDGDENVFSFIKHLHLDNMTEDNLSNNEGPSLNNQGSLPNLESMRISYADNFKMLCHKAVIPEYSSFAKLKKVEIYWCKNLKKVFHANMMSVLTCLEIFIIERCKLLEGIFELVEEANATQRCDGWLLKLSSFKLIDLPKLKYVWSKDPLELQIFENLPDFYVEGCPKLKRVYPVKTLSLLRELEIEYGELMETLDKAKSAKSVEIDWSQASMSEIIQLWDNPPQLLPRLQNLSISGCLNYKWTDLPIEIVQILPNLRRLELREIFVEEIFPNVTSNSLEGLRLYKLPKLEHVWKELESSSQINSLFLQNLIYLKIKECSRLTSLFPSSSVSSLRNLWQIIIHKCNGLRYLMNPLVATTLVRLEYMELKGCKMMMTIIESGVEKEEIVFKALTVLILEDLPRLTSFHLGKCIIRFPCLKSVSISECPEMKVFSLGITTTPLLEKRWVSLRSGSLEHMIQKDSEEEMVEDINAIILEAWGKNDGARIQHMFTGQVLIPDLEILKYEDENSLKMICINEFLPGSFIRLKRVEIAFCNNLQKVFPSNVMSILKCLTRIEIRSCALLQEIFEVQRRPSFKVDVLLPQLSSLILWDLPKLKCVWSNDSDELQIFKNMEYLFVHGCPMFEREYPQQLIELSTGNDELMEALETVKSRKEALEEKVKSLKLAKKYPFLFSKSENDPPQLLFPKLKILKLDGILDDYIWSDLPIEIVQILPNLRRLELRDIFVKEIFPNLNSNYSLEDLTLYNLPKLEHLWKELEMNSSILQNLKHLEIEECSRLNSLFPSSLVSSLTNLRHLTIHKCHGLRHLMNPRVASTLVRLQQMELKGCKMMTTVIPSSEVEEEEEEIVFKELRRLTLEDLPRLTNFYLGKSIIRFPCLDHVSIKNCPEIKVFSLGITTTPLLKKREVSLWSGSLEHMIQKDSEAEKVEDINLIIQQAWDDFYDFGIQHLFTQHEKSVKIEEVDQFESAKGS